MMKAPVGLAGLALLALLAPLLAPLPAVSQPLRLSVSERVVLPAIRELSGIVRSRKRENLYWVHNDSGAEPRLFALDARGRAILPTYSRFSYHGGEPEPGKEPWPGFRVLGAENVDWEDIAADENYLYLADTGNNLNMRRDLAIYLLSEIDPSASTQSAVIRRIPVHYPEQRSHPGLRWEYDSESLFVDDGTLYLITKHRVTGMAGRWKPGAHLYRLDSHDPEDNALTRVDSHDSLTAATAAELSPDGQRLAVLTYNGLWLFDRPASGDRWLSSASRTIELRRGDVGQIEALTWDDADTVLIGNEAGELFRLDVEPR